MKKGKQFFQKPAATLWAILVVCLAGILIINGCRKMDKMEGSEPKTGTNNMKERFFNEHKATDPLVQAVSGYFQRLPDTQFVVSKIVSRIGYPRWDKALFYVVPETAGKGNETGDSVDVTFIPFVRDSQRVVNAVLQVTTTSSDTIFRYICDWQYADSITTGNNGREQSLLLMLLDKNVFGERWYRIKDSLAYGNDSGNQTWFVKILSSSVSVNQRTLANRGNNYYAWVYTTVCTEEWVREGWVIYGCEPSYPGDPSCNGGSYQTVCRQNAYWVYFDDGGSGGSGSGGGGSTGGGGNPGGTPPECIPGSGKLYNVVPCEPGWEPIEDIPEEPSLQDTLINPCFQANNLASDPQFKAMLQDLKAHSDNANDTSEHAWVYVNSSTGYAMGSLSGDPGVKGISFNTSIPLDGVAHNHFINSLSIFSPDDIWSICKLFKDKLMMDSSKFTLPLVTAEGTQYMLMIENITKFRNWANKFLDGSLDGYYIAFNKIFSIKESNSIIENEKNFLKYLIKTNGGSGLKVFRGNADFTEWVPLGLDGSNNLITAPCQ